ncbi:hypothetical protein P12x_002427 [Tundrisphaera lichenicola]|uniref:hypothetical protein n=1 Tax=Tundrisphaera lichenicola TaxID=2029860 RepID=UPI003EBEB1DF
MAAFLPRDVSRWVVQGGAWLPADKPLVVAHYTVATTFVNNGKVIDGAKTGLSHEDFSALKAKFPDEVVDLGNGEFTLPLVPVGTVIDITPEPSAVAAESAKGADWKPAPE